MLYAYLSEKPYCDIKELDSIAFDGIIHNKIKEYILESKKRGEAIRFNALFEELGEEGGGELSAIAELKSSENDKTYDKEKYFSDCVKTLKVAGLIKESERLKILFKEEKDIEKRRILAVELDKIIKEKNKLTK